MIENILLLISSFWVLTSTQSTTDFGFLLTISHIEKSKDSHTVLEEWRLEKKNLFYKKMYSGRLSHKTPETKSVALSKEDIDELEYVIATLELQKNREIPVNTSFEAPFSAIMVSLNLVYPSQSYNLMLFDLAKNIEENKDFQHVQSFQAQLQKLFGQ